MTCIGDGWRWWCQGPTTATVGRSTTDGAAYLMATIRTTRQGEDMLLEVEPSPVRWLTMLQPRYAPPPPPITDSAATVIVSPREITEVIHMAQQETATPTAEEQEKPAEQEPELKPEATEEVLIRLELDIAQTLAALNLERRGQNRAPRIKEYTDALNAFKVQAVKLELGKPKRATLDMLKGMVKERQAQVLTALVSSATDAVKQAEVSMGDLTNEDNAFTVTATAKCRVQADNTVVIVNLRKRNAFRIGPTIKRTVKK